MGLLRAINQRWRRYWRRRLADDQVTGAAVMQDMEQRLQIAGMRAEIQMHLVRERDDH